MRLLIVNLSQNLLLLDMLALSTSLQKFDQEIKWIIWMFYAIRLAVIVVFLHASILQEVGAERGGTVRLRPTYRFAIE